MVDIYGIIEHKEKDEIKIELQALHLMYCTNTMPTMKQQCGIISSASQWQ